MDENSFEWIINEIQNWSFRSEDWLMAHYSAFATVVILKIKQIGRFVKKWIIVIYKK